MYWNNKQAPFLCNNLCKYFLIILKIWVLKIKVLSANLSEQKYKKKYRFLVAMELNNVVMGTSNTIWDNTAKGKINHLTSSTTLL